MLRPVRGFRPCYHLSYKNRSAYLSTSARRRAYEDTISNLKIGKDTRVIFQGFTGKSASIFAEKNHRIWLISLIGKQVGWSVGLV
jgi:succinyl-CoA synthetase alpha subunit